MKLEFLTLETVGWCTQNKTNSISALCSFKTRR